MFTRDKSMTFMFLVFAITGGFMMVNEIRDYRATVDLSKVAIETTAVITDIVDRNDIRMVYVMFYVDGQEYGGRISNWHSGMEVGYVTTVFYHPHNPQNFRSDTHLINSLFGAIISGVFFTIGVGYFIYPFVRVSFGNSIVNNGTRIMATFTELRPSNTWYHGHRISNLICEYRDEMNENVYLFMSEDIWSWPQFGHEQQIPLVPVYVDPNDYSKHHVAVNEFFEAIESQNYMMDYSQRVG